MKKILCCLLIITCVSQLNGASQFSEKNPLHIQVLYGPHRELYAHGTNQASPGYVTQKINDYVNSCVFCQTIADEDSTENIIIERFKYHTVFLNLFPYTYGHLLIIPYAHIDNTDKLSAEAQQELMDIMTAIPEIFETYLGANGVNIGLNVGENTGASKPRHIHVHAIPRFADELQSYENLLEQTEVAPLDLHALRDKLKPAFAKLAQKLCS